jgi:secreted trypsin-like serine protease
MKFIICLSALIVCCLSATVPLQVAVPFEKTLPGPNDLVDTSRIVNGFPATANQIPYQCSLMMPTGAGNAICGCSIISMGWSLSAAHCTIGRTQYNIRFGSLNLQTGGTLQTSFTAINHANFNPANLNNDVSLVQHASTLTASAAIQSIRLATVSQSTATFVGVQSRVSGFGQTHTGPGVSQTLNWVWMNPIPNAQCAGVYGTGVVVAHVICALGWTNPNQGHCGGDSGGPLAIQEGTIWTQIGIVAFGAAAGCTLGFPHGYMRTSHFANWVAGHTGIAARP